MRHSSDRYASNILTSDECFLIACFVEVLVDARDDEEGCAYAGSLPLIRISSNM
jgi:hypothetical protein